MSYVTKDNEKFYYFQTGDTNSPYTLIFIHGATMTGAGMAPLAEALPQYRNIVVDLPGHGNCVGESQHSVEDFADRIQYLVEKLVEEKVASEHVILVGYSMGGSISLELGSRKAKYVKRLVIISSGSDMKGNLPLIDPLNSITIDQFNYNAVMEALCGSNTRGQKGTDILNHYFKTKTTDLMSLEDLVAASHYDKLHILKDITLPTIAICGDEDMVVPVQRALNIREQVPESALCIIPYCGHAVLFEEKELVVKAIDDFIKQTNESLNSH